MMNDETPDSFLIYAYGGPETMDEVQPFLESTVFGKRIPEARLAEVRSHYAFFGGCSPMNAYARTVMALLKKADFPLPLYYAALHARPGLKETLRRMAADGRRHAKVFIPVPFGGYLNAYHERIAAVQKELSAELPAGAVLTTLDVIPPFGANPLFLEACFRTISETLETLPEARRNRAFLLFSVHSLPVVLAQHGYEAEVRAAYEALKARFPQNPAQLAWQSASAAPIPWLEPTTKDTILKIAHNYDAQNISDILLIPPGFPFENMEVAYDLDVEAAGIAEKAGLNPLRVPTCGSRPEFLTMIFETSFAQKKTGN